MTKWILDCIVLVYNCVYTLRVYNCIYIQLYTLNSFVVVVVVLLRSQNAPNGIGIPPAFWEFHLEFWTFFFRNLLHVLLTLLDDGSLFFRECLVLCLVLANGLWLFNSVM